MRRHVRESGMGAEGVVAEGEWRTETSVMIVRARAVAGIAEVTATAMKRRSGPIGRGGDARRTSRARRIYLGIARKWPHCIRRHCDCTRDLEVLFARSAVCCESRSLHPTWLSLNWVLVFSVVICEKPHFPQSDHASVMSCSARCITSSFTRSAFS